MSHPNSKLLTINGQTRSLREWSGLSSIKPITIHARLARGWSEQDAVFKPLRVAAEDLTGRDFGRWHVVSRLEVKLSKSYWTCRCSCGLVKRVQGTDLLAGKSTGCRSCNVTGMESPTYRHGKSKTAEHKIWQGIVSRCTIPSASGYANYGGRGIEVCERWLGESGFTNFLSDMGQRPTQDLSIERIDNNKDYSPDNCRWATRLEQNRNSRHNVVLNIDGLQLPVTVWAERSQTKVATIRDRLRRGWSHREAVYGKIQ
jgi:hypothetical protein